MNRSMLLAEDVLEGGVHRQLEHLVVGLQV
jgi:hypothetical protein